MLTICIPVYNCLVFNLVSSLNEQGNELEIKFEIIVIDDFSEPEFKNKNKELCVFDSVLYVELEKNIGRSAIRNLFLKYARFEFLLFLDCDSQILNNQFINNYINQCNDNCKVICGGTVYSDLIRDKQNNFRWKYGVSRESALAEIRQSNAYQHFKTNNFLIRKAVLNEIKFDERLTCYGHEDSLFAYRLKQIKICVNHIDNPVIHQVTESFDEYLNKTMQALKNLHFINSTFGLDKDFAEMNKLLKFYSMISRFYLKIPLLLAFIIVFPLIRFSFKLGFIHLRLFDFYKLGYFCWLDVGNLK